MRRKMDTGGKYGQVKLASIQTKAILFNIDTVLQTKNRHLPLKQNNLYLAYMSICQM